MVALLAGIVELLTSLGTYLSSSPVVGISALLVGTALSAAIGYYLKSKQDEIDALCSLETEIDSNREHATTAVVNLCHDLQSRATEDTRFAWIADEFSTDVYDRIDIDGIAAALPTDLATTIEEHYIEIEKNNTTLREREREQISEEPLGWHKAVQGVDGALVADILIMCSREHADKILEKGSINGDTLSSNVHIASIFGQAFGQQDAIDMLEDLDDDPVLEGMFEFQFTQSRYWEYNEDRTVDSMIENLARQRETREELNFDAVSAQVRDELDSYNAILKLLFL